MALRYLNGNSITVHLEIHPAVYDKHHNNKCIHVVHRELSRLFANIVCKRKSWKVKVVVCQKYTDDNCNLDAVVICLLSPL